MQNAEIEKAIPWNPWHGCKKVSPVHAANAGDDDRE